MWFTIPDALVHLIKTQLLQMFTYSQDQIKHFTFFSLKEIH